VDVEADQVPGQVVHLVSAFDEEPDAPHELALRTRMDGVARALLGALLVVLAAASAGAVWLLWTNETPGWWFNGIFTVMLGFLAVGVWIAYLGSISNARREAVAQRVWQQRRHTARMVPGHLVDRDVALSETGRVMRFVVAVALASGRQITAEWVPSPASGDRQLLQPQVPGVGALARVWTVDDADHRAPLVVEVLDPTVVRDAG
jgi:hypothetical protein